MKKSVRVVLTLALCSILSCSGSMHGIPTARSGEAGSWTELSLSGLDILCLAIAPSFPTTVYAGSWSSGVLRSTDRGATWVPMNNGLTDLTVFSLAVDPVVPTTVYAGTANGVFRSVNSGAAWTPVAYGATSLWVGSLAINPLVPSTLYAGTAEGVFRSVGGGATWADMGSAGNSNLRSTFRGTFTV